MAGEETNISNAIRLAAAGFDMRLFRNNRGLFYTLDRKRQVQAGLSAKGSSDLIGWKNTVITADMVGQTVPIFTAIEVKTDTGRLKPEQQHFIDAVKQAGGIAGVARSVEDVKELVK